MTGMVEQLGRLLDTFAVWLVAHDTAVALAAGGAGVAVLAVRWRIRAQQHARMRRGAATVTVVPPPRVDPAGAVVFWSNLLGLLRPALVRGGRGQPHLVFEYGFTPGGAVVSVWVPGGVAAGLVARAVAAAWPGSRTTIAPTAAALPTLRTGRGSSATSGHQREVVAGGQLRLARGAALPLDTTATGVDPIRALLAAPGSLRAGEWVRVQVLARPVSSARLARAARTGTGRSGTRVVGAITTSVRAGGDPRGAGRDRARARAAPAHLPTGLRICVLAAASADAGNRARPRRGRQGPRRRLRNLHPLPHCHHPIRHAQDPHHQSLVAITVGGE